MADIKTEARYHVLSTVQYGVGTEWRTIDGLIEGIIGGTLAHEVLGHETVTHRPLKPYWDFELSGYESMEAMAEDLPRQLTLCLSELGQKLGNIKNVHILDSSGLKDGKPIVSLHFIGNGYGSYPHGLAIKWAGLVPTRKGWDQGVYRDEGKQQLFRMWGSSKAGETRALRWVGPDGKRYPLDVIMKQNPDLARRIMRETLIQACVGEELKTVARPAAPVVVIDGDDVLGKNGQPLGDDVTVTTVAQVERLCEIAGWMDEIDRPYDVWAPEMWLLQNVGDDLGLDLSELALKVSAVCQSKHDDRSAEAILKVSRNRDQNKVRKHLGHLRAQAKRKDEGAYLRWLAEVRKPWTPPEVVELPAPEEGETKTGATVNREMGEALATGLIIMAKRQPFSFGDHNGFVGKQIKQATADTWLREAMVQIQAGGESYFLTRGRKVCPITNRQYAAWTHAKTERLMQTLDVKVYVENPHYDPAVGAVYEAKLKGGKEKPTDDEMKRGIKFNFTTFGANKFSQLGFVATQVQERLLTWAEREEFIPHLARRIPDPDIARLIGNKKIFNKFAGFPLEEMAYDPSGPQFLGSAWHRHLVHDICHGDLAEWAHLEATIADMIQRPYRVSNVAHVFQSGQGTGKLHLFRFMSNLLGAAHTMSIEDMGIYMQKFNEDQGSAILKVFEEMRAKGDQFVNNDRLKADITKLSIRVEIKGGAILDIRHCARYWFFTNHRDTLHVEADDRRYVYHSISGEHANNWDYFAPIVAELKDEAYLRACFEYFAELPYNEQAVMTAFSTSYKDEQKLGSMCLSLKFLKEFMADDGLARIALTGQADGDKVASQAIYDAYTTWCAGDNVSMGRARREVVFKAFERVGIAPPKNLRMNGTQTKCLVINREAVLAGFRSCFQLPTFEFT